MDFLIIGMVVVPFFWCYYFLWKTGKLARYTMMNDLYMCESTKCERFFRGYQLYLIEAVRGEKVCPHCLNEQYNLTLDGKNDQDENVWIRELYDSPRLPLNEIKKIVKLIKQNDKVFTEKHSLNEFYKYNKESSNKKYINSMPVK
jgi:hypothetical protein